jgi:glyceraldehyde 3-phosphate dehydrogenase
MSNKIRVSINGFGRIGRSALRAYFKYPEKYKDLEIVAINDIADLKTLAHLFKYDSVMGVFDGEVKIEGDYLVVNGKKIRAFKSNIDSIPWGEVNTDIVIESTGIFLTRKDGETHMKNGAKKVIFSAPAKEEVDATIVVGVNESTLKPTDKMVSNASCTTNCLTPLMKVLQDNFGVESAFMLTVHSYTGDQRVLDAPHKDLRRAKAVEKVLTELKGKLAGYAVRVPTPDVSLTDVTATLKKAVTVDEINEAFKREAQGSLKGVLEYVDEPVVSVDLMGNPHSSIFDSELTQVINGKGKNIRVVSWYDNEWGYSNRIMDLAKIMGNL